MARNPEAVGRAIEALLRQELGTSADISCEVHGQGREASARDTFVAMFGGGLKTEFCLTYELPGPRSPRLQLGVVYIGPFHWAPGGLFYSAELAAPLAGSLSWSKCWPLRLIKGSGSSADEKITRRPDIERRIEELLRSEGKNGQFSISIPCAEAEIAVSGAGSRLTLKTLPRYYGVFTRKFHLHAKEFVALAGDMELLLKEDTNTSSAQAGRHGEGGA